MSERHDPSIDHELSGVAMAAAHEHEQTVGSDETEAALAAVRSRIDGGDLGGAPPSIDLARQRRRRSPFIMLGAAAAVIGMIALGLVAVIGGDRTNDVITPATVPATDPITTAPNATDGVVAPPTAVEEPTTSPTTTEPAETGFVEQTFSVDAADPPPLVEPTVWQNVPIDAANVASSASVAVAADSVIVKQHNVQQVSVLGPGPDLSSTLDIDEDVDQIVAGPGPVLYGFGDPVLVDGSLGAPRAFRFVAIPFAGPNAGRVVAVDEIDPNRYQELPPDSFGEGADGVVDRDREVGTTIIGYVDENGEPFDLGAAADDLGIAFPPVVPRFDDIDGDGFPDPGQRIVTPSNGRAWNLDITRDPANGSTYSGWTAPRPTTGDRVIYTEHIGAALSNEDFAPSALPVLAILNPDGSGQWVTLPDDWDVVASDADGTILMRVTDTDFEFAFLDDALAAAGIGREAPPTETTPPTTVEGSGSNGLVQPTAIVRTCLGEFTGCTQLANTETGRIVGLDQEDNMLRVYNADGTELQAEVPIAETLESPDFWSVGPDDVAYVQTSPIDGGESGSELLAIPLVGSNAGSVVMRWTGLGTSGDGTLIPRKTGLTSVGCCGPRVTRPSPDDTIYRWVDRNGELIESSEPSFDLNLGDTGNSLTRIDTAPDGSPTFTRFGLPTALQYPRDFPDVVATDEGGALAFDFVQVQSGMYEVFVDFSPGAFDRDDSDALSNANVYYRQQQEFFRTPLLEPAGSVIVFVGGNDGQYERRSLPEVATLGWPGESRIDQTDRGDGLGSTLAPGLNEYIDAQQPFWAEVPGLFALQLKARIGPNERVEITDDSNAEAPIITVTTSGFLDDSVEGAQRVIVTERAEDGLLRFVSGSYGTRCRPGRGHQDYSLEPCT